jgi:toluene monooxygenase system ferredoxin subunit
VVTDASEYQKVCDLDDVWEGEMDVFEVAGQEVLLVHVEGGGMRAYSPICPHQDFPLIDGDLDERCILTCSAHLWQFSADSGEGVNPEGVSLNAYPVKVENDTVFVVFPTVDKAVNA